MTIIATPRAIHIEITTHCNLRCAYCSHFGSDGDVARDVSAGEWGVFFRELNRCAVTRVELTGGEPFLRGDLPEIITSIIDNRMRFSVTSNGTLITDDTAELLRATGRCDHVQISIDGATAAAHDALRGEGSFHRAVRGIRALKKKSVPVTVRVTIHKHNVRHLGDIACFLLEELALPSFSTNAASSMGLCRNAADSIQLTIDERSYAMRELVRLNRKYQNRISAAAGPLGEANMWIAMEKARRNGATLAGRGFLTGCGCTLSDLAVRADGMIVPCQQLPHMVLGRINRDDLKNIWQQHPVLTMMRGRRAIPLNSFDYCAHCVYIPYCTGNCPALAYNLMNDINHPSPDACLKRFLEAGGVLPSDDERQV